MKYSVLIADDEPAAVKMIERIIETRSDNFKVCGLAYNGQEALEFANSHEINLLITDVNMPKKNGISLATDISRTKTGVETIIVSGYQDFEYVQGAIRANSCDYILKPITPKKLLEALSRAKSKLDNDYYRLAQEKEHQYEDLQKQCKENKNEKESMYRKITLYMQEHLNEELSVEAVCKKVGISQASLNRLFRQYGSDSFKEYLISLRIQEAKNILRNVPDISIKELAEQVGYNDQFYFSKVFKNIVGVSPSEYCETLLV